MKTMEECREYNEYFDEVQGYYHDQKQKEPQLPVGPKLKKVRELQGFSIEHFSNVSGLDEDTLKKIENQEIYPDLGTIVKLSKALRIATSFLLDDDSGYNYSVVRKDERTNIARHTTGPKGRPNYQYQSLSGGIKDRHMEAFFVTLTQSKDDVHMSTHDGEEFILVMEGSVRVMLADREEVLHPGDSIYYHSTIPHYVQNISEKGDAVILAIIYAGN